MNGAVRWYQDGLNPPEEVRVATQEYRQESDPLSDFLVDRCQMGHGLSVAAEELFKEYTNWCFTSGLTEQQRLNATGFGRRMTQRFAKKSKRRGRYYEGLDLQRNATQRTF